LQILLGIPHEDPSDRMNATSTTTEDTKTQQQEHVRNSSLQDSAFFTSRCEEDDDDIYTNGNGIVVPNDEMPQLDQHNSVTGHCYPDTNLTQNQQSDPIAPNPDVITGSSPGEKDIATGLSHDENDKSVVTEETGDDGVAPVAVERQQTNLNLVTSSQTDSHIDRDSTATSAINKLNHETTDTIHKDSKESSSDPMIGDKSSSSIDEFTVKITESSSSTSLTTSLRISETEAVTTARNSESVVPSPTTRTTDSTSTEITQGSTTPHRKKSVPSGVALPLNCKWSIWLDHPKIAPPGSDFKEKLKLLGTIQSVEGFWRIFNNMKPASELSIQSNYSIFRHPIEPSWEDPRNVDGGKFVITIPKKEAKQTGKTNDTWLLTVLAVLGETMDVMGDQVNGTVVSLRKHEDRVSLWLKSSEPNICVSIGERWKKVLNIEKMKLKYVSHRTAAATGRSFRNESQFEV
jgi:translation initiation factor 4E